MESLSDLSLMPKGRPPTSRRSEMTEEMAAFSVRGEDPWSFMSCHRRRWFIPVESEAESWD